MTSSLLAHGRSPAAPACHADISVHTVQYLFIRNMWRENTVIIISNYQSSSRTAAGALASYRKYPSSYLSYRTYPPYLPSVPTLRTV